MPKILPSTNVLAVYEDALHKARARFARDSAFGPLLDTDVDPLLLDLFLIDYSALGVRLTEPVEGWIRRAGQRCVELGLGELGRRLQEHAKRESGHHRWMIEDTHALVARWNSLREPRLDADLLLSQPATDGGRMYVDLHERTIAGSTPFAQIAIEYEMELLPVQYGQPLIDQCRRLLGPGILDGLRFLQEHVVVDVGHTQFNQAQLAQLIEGHPGYVPALIEAGTRVLEAYGTFLNDCYRIAQRQMGGGLI